MRTRDADSNYWLLTMLWAVIPLPFGKAGLCLSTQNSLQLLQYGSPDSDFVKVKHFCSSKDIAIHRFSAFWLRSSAKDIAMSAKGKENRLTSLLEETIQQDGIKKKKASCIYPLSACI